ncbi:MAG: hypothetical protein JWO44_986, partial [Bacteroidetes bacterium]|nr:hypothetical protein [Bacteroidota bacterium]
RIKTSLSFNNISIPNNLWNASGQAVSNMYENTFAYDANGNITTQNRYDNAGVKFDSLSYRYKRDVSGNLLQNRLYHVNDGKSSGLQADDIDDQGVFVSTLATMNTVNNYRYDEIGNLTADSTEEIDTIKWTVYGKIKEIKRTSGSSKKNLKFDYDAGGNRIAKHVLSSAGSWERSTYYVRDAQGNVMSTYDQTGADSSLSFKLLEEHLYGSSRIGMVNPNREMIGADTTDEFAYDTLNKRQYELSNHLGNVLTVAYDRKVALDTNSDGSVDYYLADLASASDYSPFGAPLSGRGFTLSSYRYGFNGKENDNEVKGEGNQQDYGMRVYDTRLGRFLSVDPMTSSYPCLSPYAYAENDVIRCVDLDGLEKDVKVYYSNAKNAQLAKLDAGDLDWIVAKNIIAYTKWPDNGIFQIYHLKSGSYATYSYTYNGKTYTSTITGIDKAYENAQQQKNAEILRTEKFIEGVKTLGLLFTTEFVMPKVLPAGKSSASMTAKAEVQAVEQATSKATQGILSAEIKSASGIIDATVQEEGAFLSGSFKSVNGHELEFITNKVAEGKTLKLTDIVLYPKGVSGNELKNEFGPRQMTEILNIFKNFAKEKGFTKLEVKFMRAENSSSAKPGKIVTKVFDLK